MLFTIAATLYFVAVTVFIVSENRRPQSTFAWLFLFIFVPLAGVVIYVLFGRMRGGVGRTRRLLRQDLPAHLQETVARAQGEHERALAAMADGPALPLRLATLINAEQQAFVTTSNDVEVVQDAQAFYPRLMEDIRAATESIHLQYYIWRADRTGEAMRELLVAKRREGVDVRVIYDPVGSIGLKMFFYIRRLRREGIATVPSSPLWRVHTISYRNHRKIAVIDGRVGHTGGLNLGDEHLDPGHPGYANWRDTNIRVTGLAVAALQAVFSVDWANATGERLLGPEHFPEPGEGEGGHPVQLVVAGPDSKWRAVRHQYFGMVTHAEARVRVQTPYFVLDASLTEALRTAALSGLDVSVMVTRSGPDHKLPYWAAMTYLTEIAAAGVEVLLYEGGFLHAKTVVADGLVASVGSGNWDIRSFSINYELNAVIYDRGVAAELEAAYDRDRARCSRFDPEAYARLSPVWRLRDSAARLVSPLL
jgi:cardiolipin synthase A/B